MPGRDRDTLLIRAARESPVKAGCTERFGPFLHVGALPFMSALLDAPNWFGTVLGQVFGELEDFPDHADLDRVQLAHPLPEIGEHPEDVLGRVVLNLELTLGGGSGSPNFLLFSLSGRSSAVTAVQRTQQVVVPLIPTSSAEK